MSLTEMEFPSRVAQKLIRLTRSLCPARSDKLLVGRAKGQAGEPKIVVSIRGWRAKGTLVLNGAAQDRAILRARDYKPLFPRHPLSQIYPSSADTHTPSSRVRLVLLCVFNSQLCNQFVALFPALSSFHAASRSIPFLPVSVALPRKFHPFVAPRSIPPSPPSSALLYALAPVTVDPTAISSWLLSTLTFPARCGPPILTCSFLSILGNRRVLFVRACVCVCE